MYANFRLASSVARTSWFRLGSVSSCRWNDTSPVILQTAAYLITSVSSPWLLQSSSLYLQTKYIKHYCLFSFSFKHINSRRNVVQGTCIHYNETKYIKHCLFSFTFEHINNSRIKTKDYLLDLHKTNYILCLTTRHQSQR